MTWLMRALDSSLLPKNIAITCRRDASGRVHFRSASLTSHAAGRFAKIQAAVLKGHLVTPSPEVQIALALVLFDGIATEVDLTKALTGLDHLYHSSGNICLDWTDPVGRQNRRYLGRVTQRLAALPRATITDVMSTPILLQLDAFLQNVVVGPRRTYSLELLLLDAQAWLYEHLPPPLIAHCTNAVPITALSRPTLARMDSCLALAQGESPSFESRAFAAAIGSYVADSTKNQGSWFIDNLVEICRRKRGLSNSQDKTRMLRECEALASREVDIPPLGGLILAWVIDLLQSGTRTKRNLKAITPAKYVGAAAKNLWAGFHDFDIEKATPLDFLDLYQKMMDGLSPSRKRTLASALSSWHFFLTCWFEVPPLYHSLHRWVPATPPKANLLWPHELIKIRHWVGEIKPENRAHAQLRVAFEIASSIRIRARELLNLRIENIHCESDTTTIEIATRNTDGGVKTQAAKRREQTKSMVCSEILGAWCQQRYAEGAFPTDYVFGDPHRPDEKYAAGQLYADLNRLLKAVTGDTTVALHALSHTRISMDWLDAAFESPDADINPFERLSVDAGHASATTGFGNYFHFPEGWLRCCLDRAIRKHFSAWACVTGLVSKNHDAYRQAKSRARLQEPSLSSEAFAEHQIQAAAPVLLLPCSSSEVPLQVPINPMTPAATEPLTLKRTLDILNDVAFGHPPGTICFKNNLSEEKINQLGQIAINVLQIIGEIECLTQQPPIHKTIVELHRYFQSSAGEHLQFRRVGQAKITNLFDLLESGRQTEIVANGLRFWEQAYRRGYLSLESVGPGTVFIQMLDAADYPRSAIVVRGTEALKGPLMSSFRTGKAGQPRWESIQVRPGRPKAYLNLLSQAPNQTGESQMANAALGMGGIHGLCFAATVRLRMNAQWSTNTQ